MPTPSPFHLLFLTPAQLFAFPLGLRIRFRSEPEPAIVAYQNSTLLPGELTEEIYKKLDRLGQSMGTEVQVWLDNRLIRKYNPCLFMD